MVLILLDNALSLPKHLSMLVLVVLLGPLLVTRRQQQLRLQLDNPSVQGLPVPESSPSQLPLRAVP